MKIAFPNMMFPFITELVCAGDGSNRLFLLTQRGIIYVFQDTSEISNPKVFLDLTDSVTQTGAETGLLGIAFHPGYSGNGYFYVDYVAPNPTRTIIARYSVAANNSNQADPASELVLLEIAQPYANHKGGQIAFGPDGYLYIGMGDGGSGGDPLDNGQNRSTLLGKILRINVDVPSGGRNYGIPSDNPYVGNTLGYREEIYAYGFRNPWRFSFDSATGELWVGDVGQSQIEEIDVVEKGGNYGWSIMEGTRTFKSGDQTGLLLPVFEYDHTLGNAIVGGYVYRGSSLPSLAGFYIYGDFGSGRIWALQANSTIQPMNQLLLDSSLSISSFGVDQAGELYVCAFDGKIYKLSLPVISEFPNPILIVVFAGVAVGLVVAFRKRLPIARLSSG